MPFKSIALLLTHFSICLFEFIFQIYLSLFYLLNVFTVMHFHSINLTFIFIFALVTIKREYPIVSFITCESVSRA